MATRPSVGPWQKTNSDPSGKWAAITPHDSTDFSDGVCRGIYVGVGGIVVAVDWQGNAVTFKGAASGTVLPISAKRVNNTTTTATDMVALY